jgi:hypothetical protein
MSLFRAAFSHLVETSLQDQLGVGLWSPLARGLVEGRQLSLVGDAFWWSAPVLTKVYPADGQGEDQRERVLMIAAALAASLETSLAAALQKAGIEQGIQVPVVEGERIGGGVQARVARKVYQLLTVEAAEVEGYEIGRVSRVVIEQAVMRGDQVLILAQQNPRLMLGLLLFNSPLHDGVAQQVAQLASKGVKLRAFVEQQDRLRREAWWPSHAEVRSRAAAVRDLGIDRAGLVLTVHDAGDMWTWSIGAQTLGTTGVLPLDTLYTASETALRSARRRYPLWN